MGLGILVLSTEVGMVDFFERSTGELASGWRYVVGTRRDVVSGEVRVYVEVNKPATGERQLLSQSGIPATSDAAGLAVGSALANAWSVSATALPDWRRDAGSAVRGTEGFSFLVSYSPHGFQADVFDASGSRRGNPKQQIIGAPLSWSHAHQAALAWAERCVTDAVGVS